jgi:N-hydroxyarylamine O-acetyltransferase
VFDLESYLARIGLEGGDPQLADVHRAHVTSIPFETLDPQRGMAVSLAEGDLTRKLVQQRRGGYCFEQNLLLKMALEALGARVDLYLGRGLLGADPSAPRPRTHLLLGVEWHQERWHADVGFGGGTLLEPMRWGPGEDAEQAGWRYRLLERDGEYVLQSARGEVWVDLYEFLPRPVPMAEVEPANWWTSTHPGSHFIDGFLVSRQWADGRRLAMSDWGGLMLRETTPEQELTEPISREQVPRLLAERFGLPGFRLDPAGRVVRAEP